MSTTLQEVFGDYALMERHNKQTANRSPYLYILMRNDMSSMNPGKAVAQGAHATNAFVSQIMQGWDNDNISYDQKALFMGWQGSTNQGFGVTICLEVDEVQLTRTVDFCRSAGYIAGIAHDPFYPVLDGKALHLLPVNTCGWVFGPKSALTAILSQFNLHP